MQNIFKKNINETDEQFIYRVCAAKTTNGLSWPQVAHIINKELNRNYDESTYRKKYSAANRKNTSDSNDTSSYKDERLDKINCAYRKLEKERKKLQTEKLEYNKWLRENARDEMIRDTIINEVRKSSNPVPPQRKYYSQNKKAACLAFGDLHYGVQFKILGLYGEVLNEYSPEVFENRMEDLFNQVVNIIEKENIDLLYVYSLGDELDGILRAGQLMKLKYGVVESAVKYANYISTWLNELSKHVCIKYQMVYGNHTELRMLGQPKGTFKDDNASMFVREIIKTKLENNPNFEMIENPTGLIFDNICGFNLLGIHGEEKNLANAIKDFSNTYNTMIDILIGGHMHHLNEETVGVNRDVISIPSIIGIDDYSMKLNKTANPGATLFFLEEGKGVVQEYRIKL